MDLTVPAKKSVRTVSAINDGSLDELTNNIYWRILGKDATAENSVKEMVLE